jgi:hypothetical protein
MTPFEQAERELQLRGVILTKLPGEFSVTCGGALETFEALKDAVDAGRRMAAARPSASALRRPYKPDHLLKPKYRIRRRNRRLGKPRIRYAGRGRMA